MLEPGGITSASSVQAHLIEQLVRSLEHGNALRVSGALARRAALGYSLHSATVA